MSIFDDFIIGGNSVEDTDPNIEQTEQQEQNQQTTQSNEVVNTDEELISAAPILQAWFEAKEWEWNDSYVTKPGVEGIVEAFDKILEEKSVLEFPSEEAARYFDYISAGGDPAKYHKVTYDMPDYENLDLDDLDTKRSVMKDYLLATSKFNETKINKLIKNLEDTAELDNEVEEAQKYMIDYKKQKQEELFQEIENEKNDAINKINERIADQKNRLKNANILAGYELDSKTKEDLEAFAFNADKKTGKTQYQKFIESNPNWDLEAVLLAMKGVNKSKVERNALTEATKSIKNILNTEKTITNRTSNPEQKKDNSVDFDDFIIKKQL